MNEKQHLELTTQNGRTELESLPSVADGIWIFMYFLPVSIPNAPTLNGAKMHDSLVDR